jgi:hypothetical protein
MNQTVMTAPEIASRLLALAVNFTELYANLLTSGPLFPAAIG